MPTKMVSLRIDEALLKYLTERAKSEHRTLSNLIVSILLDAKEMDGSREVERIKTAAIGAGEKLKSQWVNIAESLLDGKDGTEPVDI